MSQDQPWTIGRLLTWTNDYLREHGSDSSRLDAEILLAEARGCKRIELYTAYEEVASEQTRVAFRELVRRRAEGEPVAYLVGRKEFYSLSFHVTHDVLIPRPETELIIVTMLDLAKKRPAQDGPLQIADVGTGSGVIAVTAAKYWQNSRVTAMDLSDKALEIARFNIDQHGVSERVTLIHSDLFSKVPPDARFDFILSNPPYVSQAEYKELPRDVKDHEPEMALIGGPTGCEVIARLIEQSATRLNPGGCLLIEVSPMIAAEVQHMIGDHASFASSAIVKDSAGHARVVVATRKD